MVNQNIKDAIKTIHERLTNNDIKWALVGSTNMQLQEMHVEPRDLDIVIQHRDLEKISKIFFDYSASPVKEIETLSGKPAWEVKAIIGNVEIQFFGGDENDVYVSKLLSGRTVLVKLDGIEIPCFTLEAESQAYMETNREHKAHLIQEFLSTRSK
jgi:predicted nucleotidyltransferase